MSKNHQIILASQPAGVPEPAHFAVQEAPLPVPAAGELLCRTRYLSLDPYMRSQIAGRHPSGTVNPGEMMQGETVSEILQSDQPELPQGSLVRCMGGWQQYSVHPASAVNRLDPAIEPPSYALSLLGMTGLTAYAGVVWQGAVKSGDRALIPSVTGAVGSAAAQFCRHQGARVIGIAGSEEKCRFAREQLGVEACINRHSEDIAARLQQLCPEGVNFYFDLVGGELLQTACLHLALHGRVVLCGLMAEYNQTERAPGPHPGLLIGKRAVLSGLVVYDYEPRRQEFVQQCLELLQKGEIQQLEDISHGLDSAPAAFCKLMRGENFGKPIVTL